MASPLFGILSDRVGHRRIMLLGPGFGAVAVIITAFTVSLPVIGFTRLLEGASTAASVPSILGFIAFATAADEILRGKAVARFEAATLAGLMVGFVLAGPLFQLFGPTAFLLNALVYGASFLIYRFGVPKDAEPEPAGRSHDPEEGLRRYARILRGSHVWLLAPTWIAINATLGLYTSQTLFQLVREPNPRLRQPAADGRLRPAPGLARARDRRPAVLRRPVLLGRQVPDAATDHDHPVRHRGRGRDAGGVHGDQPRARAGRCRSCWR